MSEEESLRFKQTLAKLKEVKKHCEKHCGDPSLELTENEKFQLRHEAGMKLVESAKAMIKNQQERP